MISAVRNIRGLASASVLNRALARAAQPEPVLTTAEWAEERRYVAAESGSPKPGRWKNATTPFGVEIMDCLEPEHPSRVVTLMIGSQMIKSEVILNWIGKTIDVDPAPMMLVLPSLNEIRTWNATKWEPTRKATPVLRQKVRENIERSGDGSKTNFKAFPGGSLIVATASSSKELQARSVKRAALDEISEYPDDVGGRGDPIDQVITRADAHVDAKFLLASTPAELPSCRINKFYEASDRRELYCACPECGELQTLAFERLGHFFGQIGMSCLGCGVILTDEHKRELLEGCVWLKCYPGTDENPAPPDHFDASELAHWRARGSDGRQPGFWLPQTYSPFKTWALLLREGEEAEAGSAEKRKTFRQQKLAKPWDPSVDAPDHGKLFAAKGQHVVRGVIPAWATLITGAADVQNDRIEWAAYAWGPDKSGARFDWGICAGDTLTDGPWIALADVIGRKWCGEACVDLGFDAFGVDSGGGKGRTARTYAFCQRSPRVRALKGSSDPKALIYNQGLMQKAKLSGGNFARARVDLIGGSEVKHIIMAMLHRGVDAFPTGERLPVGLYFTADTSEETFRQLTAEIFKTPKSRRAGASGYWEQLSARANEQLDLAVYCYGLAWNEGLERWGPTEWARLIAARAKTIDDAPLLNLAQREAHNFSEQEQASAADEADGGGADGSGPAVETPPATPSHPAAKMASNPSAGGTRPSWMDKFATINKGAGDR